MKVKMLTNMADPSGTYMIGKEYDLEESLAQHLLINKQASAVPVVIEATHPETAEDSVEVADAPKALEHTSESPVDLLKKVKRK